MSEPTRKLSLRSLFSHKTAQGKSATFGGDPRTDWQIVFCVFTLINIALLCINVYIYQKIDQGDIFLVDKKESVSGRTLDRFGLERTITYFEGKQERFDALLRRGPSTADPFIPRITPKR